MKDFFAYKKQVVYSLVRFNIFYPPILVSILQHAGARNEKGEPIIKDCFGSPLTARYEHLKADIIRETLWVSGLNCLSLLVMSWFACYLFSVARPMTIHCLPSWRLSTLVLVIMDLQWLVVGTPFTCMFFTLSDPHLCCLCSLYSMWNKDFLYCQNGCFLTESMLVQGRILKLVLLTFFLGTLPLMHLKVC